MKREEISLGYENEEPPTCSCEFCKYELVSPEVEPCCDCKHAHKNYFEAKTSEVMEMTNAEAREQLKHMKVFIGYDTESPMVKKMQSSLDMAIRALEKPSVNDTLDEIRAEIVMYEGDCRLASDEYPSCEQCTDNVFGSIYSILDKYKVESEVSE